MSNQTFTIEMDGNMWFARDSAFINLQESNAGFGTTPVLALAALLANGKTSSFWTVTSNTDLTEGRGFPVLLHTTHCKETALRLAKGKGGMGGAADVKEVFGIHIGAGKWALPEEFAVILKPTPEDLAAQEINRLKTKMLASGFTQKEVDLMAPKGEQK